MIVIIIFFIIIRSDTIPGHIRLIIPVKIITGISVKRVRAILIHCIIVFIFHAHFIIRSNPTVAVKLYFIFYPVFSHL